MNIASTARIRAIASGNPDAVFALLSSRANVNQPDTQGRTPLMLAAEFMPVTVGCLIDAGADVSVMDREGRTVREWGEVNHRVLMGRLGVDRG